MRRLFIIRKDLHLSPGKLAAMCSHCAEAYWMNLMKAQMHSRDAESKQEVCTFSVPADIWDHYVCDIFTKTICESRNKARLQRAVDAANELGLKEGVDYGFINDACKTELIPENEDGTCTIGMWFRPLEDEDAHKISKQFQLYRG